MPIAFPPSYPEQLEVMGAILAEELEKLVPGLASDLRDEVAVGLTERCRYAVGGVRIPALPKVDRAALRDSHIVYRSIAMEWDQCMHKALPNRPEDWRRGVVDQLLDAMRTSMGGVTVSRARSTLAERNKQIALAFKGNFTETALAFGLCVERVRQIVAEERTRGRRERDEEEGTRQ
ncbi:MAG: hypothetical protein JNJ44_02110 [Zoogloeaceae bacterium]|nr:hypothetical protein [Zoogloeaceae bacterium]